MATGNPFRSSSGASSTSGTTTARPRRSAGGGGSGGARRRPHRGRGGGGGGGGHHGGGGGGSITDPAPSNAFTDPAFDPGTMTSPGDPSKGFIFPHAKYGAGTSYLDTGEGSAAFNDPEFRNQAAWSMLNQSGASMAAPGSALQGSWLQGQVDNLIGEYEGLTMNQAPDLSFENFMYGVPGSMQQPDALPTPVTPPAPTNPYQSGTKQFRKWGKQNPATTTPPAIASPYNEAWRQATFYPALRSMMRRRWAHATPGERGVDTTRYVGPSATVAF